MILPTLMLLTLVSHAPDGAELYTKAVKPVLARRCVSCHGALKHKAGLRLDTAAGLLQGGESGPAVAPARVPDSLLLERVTSADSTFADAARRRAAAAGGNCRDSIVDRIGCEGSTGRDRPG